MTPTARITATGAYLPAQVMTNGDLERLVQTSDEWIVARTGIRERRIAAPHEAASTLGAEAARRMLDAADVDPREIDLVIAGTCSPDGMFPAVATRIQHAIGADRASSFDVNAACASYLTGLNIAKQFIANGSARKVVVLGTEAITRLLDYTDRNTCVLFGDGAGASLLEPAAPGEPGALESVVMRSDGGRAQVVYAGGPASPQGVLEQEARIFMNGRALFRAAVTEMAGACWQALTAAGTSVEEIDLFVPHQANLRIMNAAARALGLPVERMFVTVDRYGNTSSATIPIALAEAQAAGRLRPGDRVLLTTIGAGLTWGAAVVEWAEQRTGPVAAEPSLELATAR
jgi:3-oxoacyl-[acyl-carrier-protein] synthase-3